MVRIEEIDVKSRNFAAQFRKRYLFDEWTLHTHYLYKYDGRICISERNVKVYGLRPRCLVLGKREGFVYLWQKVREYYSL